jgi:hypothetical protein
VNHEKLGLRGDDSYFGEVTLIPLKQQPARTSETSAAGR